MLVVMFGAFVVRGFADWFRAPVVAPRVATGGGVDRFAAARARAAEFASVMLTFSPETVDAQKARLAGLVSGDVTVEDLVGVGGRPQRVVAAWPGAVRVEADHVAVTVTATVVRGGRQRAVYLSVPVAQDAAGGLSVVGAPALLPPPPTASGVQTQQALALDDGVLRAVEGPLSRFFAGYLSGDAVIPELLTPGLALPPLGQRLDLVRVGDPAEVGAGTPVSKVLAVSVVAKDRATHATFNFEYRVGVQRRDGRWLVNSLSG